MIEVLKTSYLFDDNDKERLKDFLLERKLTREDLVALLGISSTLLSLVVNGKRCVSKKLMQKFEEIGFEL